LEDGSGIVLLQGLDPSRYSIDELRMLYAAIARQVGTFVYSNRAGEVMRDIRDVGRDGGRAAVQRYGALPEGEGAFLSSYARTLSNGSLRFHTDRCDVVALFCVRQAILVPSYLDFCTWRQRSARETRHVFCRFSKVLWITHDDICSLLTAIVFFHYLRH
jgi:hypothetical protein